MLTHEHIEALVTAGGMAPSGGNIQPWRVVVGDSQLAIWLDGERSSSFLDAGRYASVLALGAFAENVAITAESLGLVFQLTIAERVTLDTPIAVFQMVEQRAPIEHALRPHIEHRCTNRHPHAGTAVTDAELSQLAQALGESGQLQHVDDPAGMSEVARVLAETDVFRFRHAELHRQMWEEVRFAPEEVERTRDGVDVATLELPPGADEQLAALTDYQFVRDNVDDDALRSMSEPALTASSHLCCIGLADAVSVASVLAAGRGLQRLWLTATRLQLSVQPWSVLPFLLLRQQLVADAGFSAIELARLQKLRTRLARAFQHKAHIVPLFTFRLFRSGPPSKRALRRPWQSYTSGIT